MVFRASQSLGNAVLIMGTRQLVLCNPEPLHRPIPKYRRYLRLIVGLPSFWSNRFMAADEGRERALAGSAVNFMCKPCEDGRFSRTKASALLEAKEKTMSSRHSVPITGALSGIGAVDAGCFPRASSAAQPAGRNRRRARAALQRGIRLAAAGKAHLEDDVRLEERSRERERIVHELHDTLLQGFLGASMLLEQAVEQTPADSPVKFALSRSLGLVRRAVDEGRAVLRGIHTASPALSSLEEALSNLLKEVAPGGDRRLRVFVQGTPQALNPVIQEQMFLIGREAVMNALRHSEATTIEVEVQYLHDVVRVLVRDNGCGINPEAVQEQSDSHWGLSGMRERAEKMGARFGIWSRTGVGTEMRAAVPSDIAKRHPLFAVLGKKEQDLDERQLHPNIEHRRSPASPGRYRQHHQQPGRHVPGWSGF
jgi:signal transduction histidine kinase